MSVCCSVECGKTTDSNLKCPICLKQNLQSVFCDQVCFKASWPQHKYIHLPDDKASYDPFPNFHYRGKLRPQYPLTPKRPVPKHIKLPDYANDGRPVSEIKNYKANKILIYSPQEIDKIKKCAKLSREILDVVASHIKPGISTDELDAILHKACINRNCYPSPLNYYNFPKSVCTSINEVICHGIPDQTKLEDGDIINIDVSIYYLGYHSDLNETYYVGEKSKCNPDIVRLVETTRESLQMAINAIKPGLPFREIGNIIEAYATNHDISVVRTYCGHGTGKFFHCPPDVPHYAKNKTAGIAKPGMVITVEPMLCLGTHKGIMWPDNWTSTTIDGQYLAQFEHMLLITDDGCEILTDRTATSPGGPITRI